MIGPASIIFEHGALPHIEAYIGFPPPKYRSMLCQSSLWPPNPLNNLHTWILNHCQTILGQKMMCYWEYLNENFGSFMGTPCEHTENKIPQKQKKKQSPNEPSHWLWNSLSPFSTWTNTPLPPPPPPKIRTGSSYCKCSPTSCVCIFYMIP